MEGGMEGRRKKERERRGEVKKHMAVWLHSLHHDPR